MKQLLWLDDIRDPFDGDWLVFAPIEQPYAVTWVKDYSQFTDWIEANGRPDAVCFDHDLHPEHYTPEEYWSDYGRSKAYQEARPYKEKTGKDCAQWLVGYCKENGLNLPACNVHSANPVGADWIREVLNAQAT